MLTSVRGSLQKESDIDPDNWVCVYCRQLCCCAFCRKKKAKATNTEFESRRGKKRTMRHVSRDGKRRKTESDSSSAVEDSEDFVEDEEEEYGDEEEFVNSSPAPTPTYSSSLRVSGSSMPTSPRETEANRNTARRITLKDLLDAGKI